ncbi:MAG: hypothetical protein Q8O01_01880, partial [Candidatus Omnitrophota bacterium]|nr:hypothetical protein [Candidatus Omnitrophota bacterium]
MTVMNNKEKSPISREAVFDMYLLGVIDTLYYRSFDEMRSLYPTYNDKQKIIDDLKACYKNNPKKR